MEATLGTRQGAGSVIPTSGPQQVPVPVPIQKASKGYVVLAADGDGGFAVVGGYLDKEPWTFAVTSEAAALKEAWGLLHGADPQHLTLLVAVPRRSFRVRQVDWPGVGKPFRIE